MPFAVYDMRVTMAGVRDQRLLRRSLICYSVISGWFFISSTSGALCVDWFRRRGVQGNDFDCTVSPNQMAASGRQDKLRQFNSRNLCRDFDFGSKIEHFIDIKILWRQHLALKIGYNITMPTLDRLLGTPLIKIYISKLKYILGVVAESAFQCRDQFSFSVALHSTVLL